MQINTLYKVKPSYDDGDGKIFIIVLTTNMKLLICFIQEDKMKLKELHQLIDFINDMKLGIKTIVIIKNIT